MELWPIPAEVRDVAMFLGFGQYNSGFIPNFELRVVALHSIACHNYSMPLGDLWTPAARSASDDIRSAILADPCIKRFDPTKLVVLRTDFSSFGFGYVLLQPGDDEASLSAVQDYRNGKGFAFMTKASSAVLHPICFGSRKTRGNKSCLHSHLGEGFSGNYTINKCRQYLFAQQFVWVANCYAVN